MKNKSIIFPIVFIIALFGVLFLLRPGSDTTIETVPDENEHSDIIAEDEEEDKWPSIVENLLEMIEKQENVDKEILLELGSNAYDFYDPLIIVDPYGVSPLTALVIFTSDEPLKISVHIAGKTELANVDFVFDEFNREHMIPIYGLYPGESNNVEINAMRADGIYHNNTLIIKTDPLPAELDKNIIITDLVQHDKYQEGLNFTFWQKSAFDVNGEYRWFLNQFNLLEATVYNNGNIILAEGAYLQGNLILYEINQLGKILRVYYSPYGAHHDITLMNNGNLLVTGSYGETIEDFIYEINIENGEIENTLDLKEILQRTRLEGFPSQNGYPDITTVDWFHQNSIVFDNGSIIISGRHQSSVVKLSWPEGKIEWILSDHIGWNPMFEKYLLSPIGYGFEWSYGQHAPVILPDFDNNPDTIDILLFDNGNGRITFDKELYRAILNNEIVAPEQYSRMVHYRINEKTNTVQQIWEFGKELGERYYSNWRGDAHLLNNGNRLGTFDRYNLDVGSINNNYIEVNAAGEIIWEAYATSDDEIGTYGGYRVSRLPLYTGKANDLGIGIPAKVLIPEDKLQ